MINLSTKHLIFFFILFFFQFHSGLRSFHLFFSETLDFPLFSWGISYNRTGKKRTNYRVGFSFFFSWWAEISDLISTHFLFSYSFSSIPVDLLFFSFFTPASPSRMQITTPCTTPNPPHLFSMGSRLGVGGGRGSPSNFHANRWNLTQKKRTTN